LLTAIEKTNQLIVIDFSNLAYSQYNAFLSTVKLPSDKGPRSLTDEEFAANSDAYVPTYISFAFKKLISIIKSVGSDNSISSVIFALDDNPAWKREIYPEYKEGRKKLLYNPKSILSKLLSYTNTYFAWHVSQEADDVISSLASKYPEKKVILVTTDKDLWQILYRPNVMIYNFIKKEFISRYNLEDKFQLKKDFRNIVLYKSLWGDSGDNVPNVVPRMQAGLLPIVEDCDGSLDMFWKLYEERKAGLSPRCVQLVEANKEKVIVNNKLVSLNYDLPVEMMQNEKNFGLLEQYCMRHELTTISADLHYLM